MEFFRLDTFEDFLLSFFILVSILFAFKFKDRMRENISYIVPFTLFGLVLALGMSALYTLYEVNLNLNLSLIWINLYQVIRNSFFASVGLCFFSVLEIPRPVKSLGRYCRCF